MEDKIYDYSSSFRKGQDGAVVEHKLPEEDTLVLIVRPGNKYGQAPAGARVRIPKTELADKSLLKCCATLEEYSELEAERERRRLARAERKPGRLKAMVESRLAALRPTEKKT